MQWGAQVAVARAEQERLRGQVGELTHTLASARASCDAATAQAAAEVSLCDSSCMQMLFSPSVSPCAES